MSEVFILHAEDSEGFARKVAAQLAADGYSVVRRDASGRGVERRLGDAVVVVWSEAMLAAAGMIDAARRALARRVLVPIAFGDVEPPASFAHLTPIDLKNWNGEIDDPRWQFVREEIDHARRRGEMARESLAVEPRAPARRKRANRLRSAGLIAAAGALGASAAVAVVLFDLRPVGRIDAGAENAIVLADAREPEAVIHPGTDDIAVAAPAAAPIEIPAPPQDLAINAVPSADAAGDGAASASSSEEPAVLAQVAAVEALPQETNAAEEPARSADVTAPAPAVAPEDEVGEADLKLENLPRPVADGFSGVVFRDCADCPDMAEVPAGAGGAPIAMSRKEIRFSEWQACVAAGGCARRPSDEGWGREERPVINISYEDASRYAGWLTQKTGRAYRIPTAAEWRTASAGAPAAANVAGALDRVKAGLVMTVPAGSYAPSALGLYDMRGNVAEWTSDCAAESCAARIVLGGAHDAPAPAADESRTAPSTQRSRAIGFRVARDLP